MIVIEFGVKEIVKNRLGRLQVSSSKHFSTSSTAAIIADERECNYGYITNQSYRSQQRSILHESAGNLPFFLHIVLDLHSYIFLFVL